MPRLSPLSSQGGKKLHARWRRYLVKPLKWNEIPAAHIPPDVLNRQINFLQRKSDQNTANEWCALAGEWNKSILQTNRSEGNEKGWVIEGASFRLYAAGWNGKFLSADAPMKTSWNLISALRRSWLNHQSAWIFALTTHVLKRAFEPWKVAEWEREQEILIKTLRTREAWLARFTCYGGLIRPFGLCAEDWPSATANTHRSAAQKRRSSCACFGSNRFHFKLASPLRGAP